MIYLTNIYNQLQELEKSSLTNNRVKVGKELKHLLLAICPPEEENPSYSCDWDTKAFVLLEARDEDAVVQVPPEVINKIKQAIKDLFRHISTDVKNQQTNSNGLMIKLSNLPQFSYLVVIKDLLKLEFDLEPNNQFNFEGYLSTFELRVNKEEYMAQFFTAMEALSENFEIMFKNCDQKSANK